jgi:hypothetical protein
MDAIPVSKRIKHSETTSSHISTDALFAWVDLLPPHYQSDLIYFIRTYTDLIDGSNLDNYTTTVTVDNVSHPIIVMSIKKLSPWCMTRLALATKLPSQTKISSLRLTLVPFQTKICKEEYNTYAAIVTNDLGEEFKLVCLPSDHGYVFDADDHVEIQRAKDALKRRAILRSMMSMADSAHAQEFPPGEYYIGDPCHICPESTWDEILKEANWFTTTQVVEGYRVFIYAQPLARLQISCANQLGSEKFPIESGMIGLVPMALIWKLNAKTKFSDQTITRLKELGTIFEFDESFQASHHRHIFKFGQRVLINTKSSLK